MTWSNPPGMATGGRGGGRGGGGGLPALPGTYTATVSVGGTTAAKTFELRGDPDVALPLADYQAQYDAARKARDLVVTVGQLVSTVDDLSAQIDNVEAQARPGVSPPEPVASLATIAVTRPAMRRCASVWAVGHAATKITDPGMPRVLFYLKAMAASPMVGARGGRTRRGVRPRHARRGRPSNLGGPRLSSVDPGVAETR
jgi:hypothetical protein